MEYFLGTSSACPHVSGVAALILSVDSSLTTNEVRNIIEQTAQKVGGYGYGIDTIHLNGKWNNEVGYGLVDAHKAVTTAKLYHSNFSISGPTYVNTCGEYIYTLLGTVPNNFEITWETSPYICIVEGQGTPTIKVRALYPSLQNSITAKICFMGAVGKTTVKNSIVSAGQGYIPLTNVDTIITQSNTIFEELSLGNSLSIDSGAILTITSTIHCTDNARIIVRPGGKLIVDGGTLTSACSGEMWQGIEIEGDRTKRQLPQYQGKVELRNGATIENAMCGIRTCLSSDISYLTAGGIIEADQAVFRNNRRAIEINSYKYYAPSGNVSDYVSSFNRCTFTVDNNNLFSANYTSFSEHVKLWDVKNIPFRGCSFSNLTNNSSNLGRGIYADDAGVIVSTHCTRPLYVNECECPASIATVSFFSGFNTAMEVITTGNPYSVTVDQTKFSNNDVGLRVNANNYVTVTRDTFNLQSAPIASSNTGLVLDNCSGYKVEGNRFHKAYRDASLSSSGIHVINSGSAVNQIYKNLFDTLDYGIVTFQSNSGLQLSCDSFNYGNNDIYISNGTIASIQGSLLQGADNKFVNTQNSSIYNGPNMRLTYYHSPVSYNVPSNPYHVTVNGTAGACDCLSTLCDNGSGSNPFLLTGFLSGMEAYTTAVGNDDGGGDRTELRHSLSETYYESVRALMADSVLDLNALEQWHAAAQPIADPYSLTETQFMLGYDDLFAADADNTELANYADFHSMKLALRNAGVCDTPQQDGHINWYALTPAQIAQLQVIAERNAGRASVMAKGVLCFFHGICYDDDSFVDDNVDNNDNNDNNMETRSAKASPQDGETRLNVYPNPTDDLLFVELSGAGIQSAALFDLQGRVVTNAGVCDTPQRGTATMNLRSIPAGVYLLRVTDTDGKEYHQKIVKK
jgi:hypothetical protein